MKEKRIKEQREFAHLILNKMKTIKGGHYEMGELLSVGSDWKRESPHIIELSDFQISPYLTTWYEYEKYAQIRGMKIQKFALALNPSISEQTMLVDNLNASDMAASVRWSEAREYCRWLGKIVDKNIDLPTEAQWEYVARNRGKEVFFATNNGVLEQGKNIPTGLNASPVGTYPPNPLGIYDLITGGSEWMYDWYDEMYYRYSKEKDPAGAIQGTLKSIRPIYGKDIDNKVTYVRGSADPSLIPKIQLENESQNQHIIMPGYHFRCAIHTAPLIPNSSYSEFFVLKNEKTGKPIPYMPYRITTESGKEYRGTTDKNGKTMEVFTSKPETISVSFGRQY